MFSKIANFITKIQNSDETTKKIWLVILSGTTMTIVVALWLINLNVNIKTVGETEKKNSMETVSENQKEIGQLKEIFSAGLKTITEKIKEKASVQKEIYLQASEQNFILESLEKIPKTSIL